jgi:hypothetical protein
MRGFARRRSPPRQLPPVGRKFDTSATWTRASSVFLMAAASAPVAVAVCRSVRGDAVVRRSSGAERSRIIAQWCADRLTALLIGTLTAVLTDELVGRFSSVRPSRSGRARAPAAPSNTHSNTHRSRSRPCEWSGSAGAPRAVFGLPYRTADQIAGRHETSASHSRASREVRYRSGQHQQEREDAPSPRRQPRRGVADGLQGATAPVQPSGRCRALTPAGATKSPPQWTTLREDGANRKCRNARTSAPGVVAPGTLCRRCEARTPLAVTPMQAVSAGLDVPRGQSCCSPRPRASIVPHAQANSRRRRRRGWSGDQSRPVILTV